ncbi:hypothetical protein P5775_31385 [Bacillus cereus]|uniref:hypothetical protein n=1 Tax=Bacillus cereus group TaxID=86661 RepID=UPI002404D6D5|nr:hypothetical protein [Bacillus cereus]MDF9627154.1 hypothetical protein [Bacillus cereus]
MAKEQMKLYVSEEEKDKLVLEELLERTQGKKDFITLDREFNMRLRSQNDY